MLRRPSAPVADQDLSLARAIAILASLVPLAFLVLAAEHQAGAVWDVYWPALRTAPLETALSPLSLYIAAHVALLSLGVRGLKSGGKQLFAPAFARVRREWRDRR